MLLALLAASLALGPDPAGGLTVPDGFAVSLFAGPELANDIFTIHTDAKGRVVVAGPKYVRHLLDTDGDGKADKAVDLIPPPPDGAMGLLWEGDTLFVVGDGGLKKFAGVTGQGPTKEKPTLLLKLNTGGEHHAHAVRRGPDGKLWVLCGNNTGISAKTITSEKSPIQEPVAGCLLRLNDDGTGVEVFADGFRNAYGFDFDTSGVPYTFDSDNERCVGLPWYEPCRLYRVPSGGHHGWINPQHGITWRYPPYYPDVVPPVLTAGRGSPTAVECGRHTRFPKDYQGGVFFADWTFGVVWFTQPGAKEPKAEKFVSVGGTDGFAPTGLALDPTSGDLLVSVGGRGTRGAVYRISPTAAKEGKPIPFDPKPLPAFATPMPNMKAAALANAKTDKEKLAVVCGWFTGLGGVGHPLMKNTTWEGYSFRVAPKPDDLNPLVKAAREAFPTADADLNRELSRFLAASTDDDNAGLWKVLALLKKQTDPAERMHYLFVFARLQCGRIPEVSAQIAEVLLTFDEAYRKAGVGRDTNWTVRMNEAMEKLTQRDKELGSVIGRSKLFGAGDHLWLAKWTGLSKSELARAFDRHANADQNYGYQLAHAEYLYELGETVARPHLERMKQAGFGDAVTVQLARFGSQKDREIFVHGLASSSAAVVQACADALLPFRTFEDVEVLALVKALRRFKDPKKDTDVREVLLKLVKRRTGQDFNTTVEWEKWLTEKLPEQAKQLGGTGYDAAAWAKRSAGIAWDKGDATKGKAVFAKAQCAACHAGGQAIGPALAGVGKRFNQADLLTTVVDPSRDVADRYRAVRFAMKDDTVHDGIVIYEATDGVMIQTAADKTVRLAGKSIESRKVSTLSLMPTGLLDALKDDEVADLFAYLKKLE